MDCLKIIINNAKINFLTSYLQKIFCCPPISSKNIITDKISQGR